MRFFEDTNLRSVSEEKLRSVVLLAGCLDYARRSYVQTVAAWVRKARGADTAPVRYEIQHGTDCGAGEHRVWSFGSPRQADMECRSLAFVAT